MGWRIAAYRAVRPVLFRFEPERIHRLTIDALRVAGGNPAGRAVAGLLAGAGRHHRPVEIAGIAFRSRVGVAAGFDKDATALRGWAALGCGFVEVGTVTPLPQRGNPRPRLFRLTADEALINRLGFNSAGAATVARSVMLARRHLPDGFVVGVNLGRNRDTPPDGTIDDYRAAQRLLAPVADYVVINVSSPNTPGLRELQSPDRLRALVEAIADEGERLRAARPILVKVAPDLADGVLERLVEAILDGPAAGVVVANTSVARDGLVSPAELTAEPGGLSGPPLLPRAAAAVATVRRIAGERLAIAASGGIHSAADVDLLRAAGADLLQLWTGLVYRGPGLIGEATAAA